MYQPEFSYPFEEWDSHFEAAASHPRERANSSRLLWATDCFSGQYSDPEEARYKMDRFLAAMAFWATHSEEFDFDGLSVDGNEVSLVGFPLVMALYRFYSGIPDEHLGVTHPSVESLKSDAMRYDK